ncbi:CMP-sialic acid transporter isoform X2 [Lontra canadensis]|uniref:CMP-sialic acid transporter isoform X2 n=1 Tax=Lontra canadensis TaxID=76717 RepID=UPI0013F35079|nr:CMP-sialic acid transporter isoform X2 [Lontra canadensis]
MTPSTRVLCTCQHRLGRKGLSSIRVFPFSGVARIAEPNLGARLGRKSADGRPTRRSRPNDFRLYDHKEAVSGVPRTARGGGVRQFRAGLSGNHGCPKRETGSPGRFKASLRENVLGSPKELMKLSVPSLVYAVQNNMAFLALSNLDAAVYQVTYQLKIPCTALCTVLMLNRTLSKLQWISVFMLCGGVILVQWEPAQATKVVVEQNPLLGFGAVAIAVLCSGFAGVYFEKVLKSSDTSLWVRNIQMYLSGIVVTLVGVYLSDGAEINEKGFFYGYTYYVWFVIFLASVGGLYTSVVVKYTDNIMKGFSAAAAIVLSTIASVMLFGLQITLTFALGTLLVCVSIYLYGLPRQDTTSIQQGEIASKERVGGT